ncbi:hypothetical protein EYF80_056565 [Liparis tanakae]|uniref:Uncharacterized protein n=1 Tax=Liparis tanakae TaxID=230148 RepID=A0A4Z2EY65_9TELE|nr:hypothetical protein EYF80_056565 [Liparis tanakae]
MFISLHINPAEHEDHGEGTGEERARSLIAAGVEISRRRNGDQRRRYGEGQRAKLPLIIIMLALIWSLHQEPPSAASISSLHPSRDTCHRALSYNGAAGADSRGTVR